MAPSTLYRLSGLALLIGGLLSTGSVALHPPDGNMVTAINVPIHVALYAGVMLVLFGLPGLCARVAQRAGALGLVGSVLLFFGLAFEDPMHSVLEFTVVPIIAANPATRSLMDGPPPGLFMPLQMLGVLAIFAGLVVLAVAVLRTGVLPRWLAAPMILTVVLVPLGFAVPPMRELGPALLYLTLAGLGYPLLSAGRKAAAPMVTARPAYS